jgi:ribosomal protein S18 acetylase RimI-like enzyme
MTKVDPKVSAQVSLRLATLEEAEILRLICYPTFTLPEFLPFLERVLKRQAAGRACFFLLTVNQEPVAAALLSRLAHTAELSDLAVLPAYQRQGWGRYLVQTLMAYAQQHSWLPLEIGVKSQNTAALALYQQVGFVPDRTLKLLDGDTALILRWPDEEMSN